MERSDLPEFVVAASGHRPGKLGGFDSDAPLNVWVRKELTHWLESLQLVHAAIWLLFPV